MNTALIRRQRETVRSGLRQRMIARAGFDPRAAGKAYNRVAEPPAPANGMDPDRLAIPTGQAELEAMLTDSAKMQKVFADKNGAFGEFVTNYARAVHNRDLSIATQVKEQTEQILANWLRENQPDGVDRLDLTPKAVVQTGNARNHLHNPKAMGAVLDREFKNSAEYFQTIWHNANRTADMQAKLTRVRNAFSSTVPSEGGFLIPEQLRAEMLAVALETSVVRQRARVIPMETLRVPFPAIDSTSNVSSVYGGVVGYWTEEGAALTASQAAFSRIVLDAKKLTAYTEVPNELISDSAISFQAFLDQIFPEALSFYEDIAMLKGTGVGEPLGALSAGNGAIVEVAKESSQPADTIVWENIVKMYARMLPSSLDRAVWVCSIDVFPQLATMALSVGTGFPAISPGA